MSGRVVVVGNGMAGLRVVQDLLELDRDRRLRLTVVGDEPGGAYNRILLSNVVAGRTAAADVLLADESWYERNGVELRTGTAATRIDRDEHLLELSDGQAVGYDKLVLATGSRAVLPEVDGLQRAGHLVAGAVAFRTLADCVEIDRRASGVRSAVVVGAGVLGLEAARGLAGRGLRVTLLQRGPRLLERQLDAPAARLLARSAAALGVEVRRAGLLRVHADGGVRAIELDDGAIVETELLVLCCGVRPRAELAAAAGLTVTSGIAVDDAMRSPDDPDVLAVGDCAEHRGRVYGLVAPAWEQARVAAQTLAGTPAAYTGSREVTRLKASGLELACLGESSGDGDGDGDGGDDGGDDGHDDAADEIVRFSDSARRSYQKLVIRNGRLVGAILLGDTRTVGIVTQLYDRGGVVPSDRADLLLPRRDATVATDSPTTLPGRATICHCNGVTKSALCDAWAGGARTVDDLATATRATTGCGTCRDTVAGIAQWLAAADPDTHGPEPEPVPTAGRG